MMLFNRLYYGTSFKPHTEKIKTHDDKKIVTFLKQQNIKNNNSYYNIIVSSLCFSSSFSPQILEVWEVLSHERSSTTS